MPCASIQPEGRTATPRVRRHFFLACFLGLLSLLVVSCSSSDDGGPDTHDDSGAAAATAGEATPTEDSSYVLFNQRWVEGLSGDRVDLTDVDSIFVRVFASLPDEVTVYPSENYYYFILHANGRQIWGNIRLPAGRREHGVLSFGYFEFIEFPSASAQGLSGSKFFTDADGVIVTEVDRHTYSVRFNRKTVTFRFNQLDQDVPRYFSWVRTSDSSNARSTNRDISSIYCSTSKTATSYGY